MHLSAVRLWKHLVLFGVMACRTKNPGGAPAFKEQDLMANEPANLGVDWYKAGDPKGWDLPNPEPSSNAGASAGETKWDLPYKAPSPDCTDQAIDCRQEAQALLKVSTDRPEATVLIDGIVAGNQGDWIAIKPGTRNVSVSSPGFKPKDEIILFKKGEQMLRDFRFNP